MNILIIAPHPDDDVLGCGGSILKHQHQGDNISIAYMTSGESGDAKIPKPELAKMRESELEEAAHVLNISDLIFFHQPDGGVALNPQILQEITELVRLKKPELMYIPHQKDGHKDHRVTNEICMEAIYRANAGAFQEYHYETWEVKSILAYEVWTPLEKVNYVEDISPFIDQKIRALQKHKSQLNNVAYDEAIRGLNRYRGALTGKGEYCECFTILKASTIC